MTANEITNAILLRIPSEIPGAKAWRHNVGAMKTDHRFIRFGQPGEADITGIVPGGRRIEIEVKVGRNRLTDRQRNFLDMIRSAGGIAIVARDPDAAMQELRSYVLSHRTSSTTPEPEKADRPGCTAIHDSR